MAYNELSEITHGELVTADWLNDIRNNFISSAIGVVTGDNQIPISSGANALDKINAPSSTVTNSVLHSLQGARPNWVDINSIVSSSSFTINDIPNGGITNEKLASKTITRDKIFDGTISNSLLADNAVTVSKIANEVFTTIQTSINTATDGKLDTVKPKNITANNTPSAGQIPSFIDSDTWGWITPSSGGGGSGGGGLSVQNFIEHTFTQNTGSNSYRRTLLPNAESIGTIHDDDVFIIAVKARELDDTGNNFRQAVRFIFSGKRWKSLTAYNGAASIPATTNSTDNIQGSGEGLVSRVYIFRNTDNSVIISLGRDKEYHIDGFYFNSQASGANVDTATLMGLIQQQLEDDMLTQEGITAFIRSKLTAETSQSYNNVVFPEQRYIGEDLTKVRSVTTTQTMTVITAGRLSMRALPNRGSFDNRPITVILDVKDSNDISLYRSALSASNNKDIAFTVDNDNETLTFELTVNKHGVAANFTELAMTFGFINVSQGGEFIPIIEDISSQVAHRETDHLISDIAAVDVKTEANARDITAVDTRVTTVNTRIDNLPAEYQENPVLTALLENATIVKTTESYRSGTHVVNDEFSLITSGQFLKHRPNFITNTDDSDADGNLVAQVVNELDPSSEITTTILPDGTVYPIQDIQTNTDPIHSNGLEISTNGLLTGPGVSGGAIQINLPSNDNNNIVAGWRMASINNSNGDLIAFKRRDNGQFFPLAVIENRQLKTIGYAAGTSQERTITQLIRSDGQYFRKYAAAHNELEAFCWELPEPDTYTIRATIVSNGNPNGTYMETLTNFDTSARFEGITQITPTSGDPIDVILDYKPASQSSSGNNELCIEFRANSGLPINVITVSVTRDITETIVNPGGSTKSSGRYTFEAGKVYYILVHENPTDVRHRWNVQVYNLTDGTSDMVANVGTDYGELAIDTSAIRIGGAGQAFQDIAVSQLETTLTSNNAIIGNLTASNFDKSEFLWGYVEEGTEHEIQINGVMNALPFLVQPEDTRNVILSNADATTRKINVIALPAPNDYSEIYAIIDDRTSNRTQREIRIDSQVLRLVTGNSNRRIESNGIEFLYHSDNTINPDSEERVSGRTLTIIENTSLAQNYRFAYVETRG